MCFFFFFFKQKTAYEMRISDWSSDVCSSDLPAYDVQGIGIDDLIDFTPELRKQAVELVKQYKIGPLYTPPVVSKPGRWGTISVPGIQGGTNWPGGCYDPESHTVFVYSKTQPSVIGIIPNDDPSVRSEEHTSERKSVM